MIHNALHSTALRLNLPLPRRSALLVLTAGCLLMADCFALSAAEEAEAPIIQRGHTPLVRSRKPDRGTYQPPVIGSTALEETSPEPMAQPRNRRSASQSRRQRIDALPQPIVLETPQPERRGDASYAAANDSAANPIRRVSHDVPVEAGVSPHQNAQRGPARVVRQSIGFQDQDPLHVVSPSDASSCSCAECLANSVHDAPHRAPESWIHESGPRVAQAGPHSETGRTPPRRSSSGRAARPMTLFERASHVVAGGPIYESSMAYESMGMSSCDESCCDDPGCDSMGCGHAKRCIGRHWFGSLELLLMFRKGDRLPPLVTTGAIGDANTQVLFGSETVLKDMTAGGRLTIGSWLDSCKDRSFVGRAWFAGEQSDSFVSSQAQNPEMSRPFFNVTDGEIPAQDTQVIASAGRATGVVNVHLESQVYGADLSIRQLWKKQYGGTLDLLYGYQFMRADESLGIATRSTSLDDDFAPVGAVLEVSDVFDVQNEFHGGQIGIASNYREGCWSFSSLWKLGFGNVRRRANLIGSTTSSIDGDVFTDPNGLLVRSTNAGLRSDSTFSWVPELDLTLGWQQFPSFDVTFGYHLIAMTEALQVSGAMDPNLASNLADPPLGAQRPSANFRYGTIYVQGIHFGLNYIY